MTTKTADELLREANQVLRSAYAIADRNGKRANWHLFKARCKKALVDQHKHFNPEGIVPKRRTG